MTKPMTSTESDLQRDIQRRWGRTQKHRREYKAQSARARRRHLKRLTRREMQAEG